MTSMRIDGGKSAKLWAKRLQKLIAAIEEDGAEIRVHPMVAIIGVFKDDEGWTHQGRNAENP